METQRSTRSIGGGASAATGSDIGVTSRTDASDSGARAPLRRDASVSSSADDNATTNRTASAAPAPSDTGARPPLRRQRSMLRLRTAVINGNQEDMAAVLDCAFRGLDSPLSHFGFHDLILMSTFRMQQCLRDGRELLELFHHLRLLCWCLLNEHDAGTPESAGVLLALLEGDLDMERRFTVPKVVTYMAGKPPEHMPRAVLKLDRSNNWMTILLAALALRLHTVCPQGISALLAAKWPVHGVRSVGANLSVLVHATDVAARTVGASSIVIARCGLQALGNVIMAARDDAALLTGREDSSRAAFHELLRNSCRTLSAGIATLLPHLAGVDRADVLEAMYSFASFASIIGSCEEGQLYMISRELTNDVGWTGLDAVMRALMELQSMARSNVSERVLTSLIGALHMCVGNVACRALCQQAGYLEVVMRCLDGHVPAQTELSQAMTLAALIPLLLDRSTRARLIELGVMGPLINLLGVTATDGEDAGSGSPTGRRTSVSGGAMASRLATRRRSSVASVGSVSGGADTSAQVRNSQLYAASAVLIILEDDAEDGAVIQRFVALRGLDATLAACPPCANLEVLSLLLHILLVCVTTANVDEHAALLTKSGAVPLLLYLCARHWIALATAAARRAGSRQRTARTGIRGGPTMGGLGATAGMTSRRGSASGPTSSSVVVGAAGVMPIPVVHDMVVAASATTGAVPDDKFGILPLALQTLVSVTGARLGPNACNIFMACGGIALCQRILRPVDADGPIESARIAPVLDMAPSLPSLAAALVTNMLSELPVEAPDAVLLQFGGIGMLDAVEVAHAGNVEVQRLVKRMQGWTAAHQALVEEARGHAAPTRAPRRSSYGRVSLTQ